MQNEWFAFWPKAGFTYLRNVAKTDSADVAQFRGALTVKVSCLFKPTDHVFLSLAPMIDWGILGANSVGSGDNIRATALESGIQGGLGVYFWGGRFGQKRFALRKTVAAAGRKPTWDKLGINLGAAPESTWDGERGREVVGIGLVFPGCSSPSVRLPMLGARDWARGWGREEDG